jgi:hypothetical protein
MSRNSLIVTLVSAGLVLLLAGVIIYQWYATRSKPPVEAIFEHTGPPWTWQNPVTREKVAIPSDWAQFKGRDVKGSVLTLTHWTDKCIIYLVHDTTSGNVSLPEYVAANKDTIKNELGIDKVEKMEGVDAYEGEGAKLMGKAVPNTRVRIWRGKPDSFWRAAVIIDPDYKNLEYDTGTVIDLLMKTTL